MRQDVRLHNYYYGCSRGSSVLLIVRVAQVTYWRHYYDYDLSLACFQYISSVSHFKSRLHHGPNNQMMDGHFFRIARSPTLSASLTPKARSRRRGCDRAGRTESSSAGFGQLSTSSTNSLCHSAGRAAHVSPHLLVPSEGPVAVVADAIELAGLEVGQQGLVLSRQVPPIRSDDLPGFHKILPGLVGGLLQCSALLGEAFGDLLPLLVLVRGLLLLARRHELLNRDFRLCSTADWVLDGCQQHMLVSDNLEKESGEGSS